jgi:phage tail-like protein
MMTRDYKSQIFSTPDQWEKGGLRYRLDAIKGGGLTLDSSPAFSNWILKADRIQNLQGLAVDECGQVYFIDGDSDTKTRRLYRYDMNSQVLEYITSIDGCDPVESPARMLMDAFTLWVLDTVNREVIAFSRDNFQIKYILRGNNPVDFGIDRKGHIYVLDKDSREIFKYTVNGIPVDNFRGNQNQVIEPIELIEPVGLSVNIDNSIYVIDNGYKHFIKITEKGEYSNIGDFTKISEDFRPKIITIDTKENVFVAGIDNSTESLYRFDSDGSYTGKIPVFDLTGRIMGLAVDSKANLYLGSSNGIAHFSSLQVFSTIEGFFYSKTLDSGIHECKWHRLSLQARIPQKTLLHVYYYVSDSSSLKKTIDGILTDQEKSTQEKADSIDKQIPAWIGPETLTGNEITSRDMLFREGTGRYLWLKIGLLTFDEKAGPEVTRMKMLYPANSYLRYLPAIYQEDPVSREFLERFLSIFETVLYDLETDIDNVSDYFDPDIVPSGFLAWLASWLNMAVEEDWTDDKKRYFIKRAPVLYKQKGTRAGLEELIRIYTEKIPIIMEHSRTGKPMVISKDGSFILGINSLLLKTPVRGFRLGDDSIIGQVALREIYQSQEEPFLALAYRFTVIMNLSAEELRRYEKGLRQILDNEKPAHTMYRIQTGVEDGSDQYVGISTQIVDYGHIRLGDTYAIGSGIIVSNEEQGGKLDRNSRLNKDTDLV